MFDVRCPVQYGQDVIQSLLDVRLTSLSNTLNKIEGFVKGVLTKTKLLLVNGVRKTILEARLGMLGRSKIFYWFGVF